MKVTVSVTKSFKTAVKPLLKKHKSLSKDLLELEKELIITPKTGTPLGSNIFKIRLKISSKAKGKSGGARVISMVESTVIGYTNSNENEETTVYLLTIYDKSEIASISDKELKDLIKSIKET